VRQREQVDCGFPYAGSARRRSPRTDPADPAGPALTNAGGTAATSSRPAAAGAAAAGDNSTPGELDFLLELDEDEARAKGIAESACFVHWSIRGFRWFFCRCCGEELFLNSRPLAWVDRRSVPHCPFCDDELEQVR